MSPILKFFKTPVDFFVTLILWLYFLFGYIIIYIPVLILAIPFSRDMERMFQKANHTFYRVFFRLLVAITPGLSIHISEDVSSIQSAVVVVNHRSYLDPILLISLFPRHKTIVKGVFFKLPIMRWVMKSGGYIPFARHGEFNELMVEGIKTMDSFFHKGGVVFIFPEGKRSRDGKLGQFQKGAFSIACKFGTPVELLYINNTDRLFRPGTFLFNTCEKISISVEKIGMIVPGHDSNARAREMKHEALQIYERRITGDKSNN